MWDVQVNDMPIGNQTGICALQQASRNGIGVPVMRPATEAEIDDVDSASRATVCFWSVQSQSHG